FAGPPLPASFNAAAGAFDFLAFGRTVSPYAGATVSVLDAVTVRVPGFPAVEVRSSCTPGVAELLRGGVPVPGSGASDGAPFAAFPEVTVWLAGNAFTLLWPSLNVRMQVTVWPWGGTAYMNAAVSLPTSLIGGVWGRGASWGLLGTYDGDLANEFT